MVHSPAAATRSRRERTRDARRRAFLRAAQALVEADGLESLTIKALADRLDCAVGSLYTYFPSKDALVAAMQAGAIETLARAFDRAADRLADHLDAEDVPDGERLLVKLVVFGRCVVAAEHVYPHELHLQQRLLAQPGEIADPDEVAKVVPVAFDMLDRPRRLLDEAARAGILSEGNAFDRTVTWAAALNGVAMVGGIQHADAGLFDVALLADRLSLDLLAGWGADRDALDRAAATVPPELVRTLLARVPEEES